MKDELFTARWTQGFSSQRDLTSGHVKHRKYAEDKKQPEMIFHEYGYRFGAKKDDTCYIYRREPFYTESHTDTNGKTWPKTYHHEVWYVFMENGSVVSMTTAATRKWLKADRKNGKVVYDTTGQGKALMDSYEHKMSR